MTFQSTFDSLTDDQLVAEIQRLATNERCATANLLRALMEVDTRRLYLREGCSSLYTYCTQVLHLDESAAYNRIEVARAARRLPALLGAIADSSITLTSARLLSPHLTVENHAELLSAARHRSKREVEVLIAGLAPRPAVPTVLRKLPLASQAVSAVPAVTRVHPPTQDSETIDAASPALVIGKEQANSPVAHPADRLDQPLSQMAPPRRVTVAPLSTGTYKLQLTISAATHDKLRRVRDLLRHSIPTGDVAEVLDRALTLLLQDLERRRCATVARPRESVIAKSQGRHIPAAVKREVWRRDAGRCAFSSGTRRCTETAFLEFHHVIPYADGGAATVANIELRCRAHNQYEAALLFADAGEMVRETAAAW
jgi:5-methylcytosine-specific restriction endonuclease McrA